MDRLLEVLLYPALSQITYVDLLIRVACAVVVGGLIGIEREKHNRPAGLRTHILVCLGACVMSVTECLLVREISGGDFHGVSMTVGRIVAQVVSGVGFLGAGTIVMSKRKISGLTTAASLWNAACLGIAVGFGFYVLALVSGILVFIVLSVLARIVHVNTEKRVEVKFIHRVETLAFINEYFDKKGVTVLDIDFHVENSDERNLYTNVYQLKLPSDVSYTDIVGHISEYKNIQSIRTTNIG